MFQIPVPGSRSLPLVLDLAERAVLVVLFGWMSLSFLRGFQESGHWVNLLLLASEGSVVAFVLIRRFTTDVSLRPTDWVIAFAGTAAPLLVRPVPDAGLAPAALCGLIITIGFLVQIAAKLTLRRSFGVVAANRGVKVGGPYRVVRHPMYAGYVVAQVGFLLMNPSLWNVAVYGIAFGLQITRLLAEERVLGRDQAYRDFVTSVRYRLVPGVF